MARRLNVEYDSYKDLVRARAEEIETGETLIDIPTYQYKYVNKSASALKVCDTPALLRSMGFEPEITYDLEHFHDHMLPDPSEQNGARHGHKIMFASSHTGTMEEMLMLPELLQNPIAIVGPKAIETDINNNRSDMPIGILFACKIDGNQEYKMAIINPSDYDSSIIKGICEFDAGRITQPPYVSKIQTFHDIPEQKFARIMEAATQNNNANLLYFNKNIYNNIQFHNEKNNHWQGLDFNQVKHIKDFSHQGTNLQVRAMRHVSNIRYAISSCLNEYSNPRFMANSQTQHPYVENLLDIVKHGNKHSFEDLVYAHQMCCHLAKNYCENPKEVMIQLNKDFLPHYIEHLNNRTFADVLDPHLQGIKDFDMSIEGADEAIWDAVNDYEEHIPTLENLGIDATYCPNGALFASASETSNQLSEAAKIASDELIEDKLNEYDMMFEQGDIEFDDN